MLTRPEACPSGYMENLVEPKTQVEAFFSIRLRVSVRPEPLHRFLQRDLNRRLREAEFSDGFAAVVVHLVFGHLDAFKRNAWRQAGQIRDPLVGIGQRYFPLDRRLRAPLPSHHPATTPRLLLGVGLYYGVLAFNLGVTFWIGESLQGTTGLLMYVPVTALLLLRLLTPPAPSA